MQVQAWPSSLRVLGQDDCRVPSNLVNPQVLRSVDGMHAWLAPFAPSLVGADEQRGAENVICILFDCPVSQWPADKRGRRATRSACCSACVWLSVAVD